ncbi:uncharacterized protein LOC128035488 [Gossypium raimondii]|uniref:uncharacterized protein LOC128035488 n=1 Tax=Gossypium raimondii TaxID=29730 RepID=UPI00227D0605|nr:uncharacterized protein LOC128035488 [Gossypium raimondii]
MRKTFRLLQTNMSYADLKRRDVEYQVSEHVFLKVSPWKNVLRFRCKEKLSPRFIGPYEMVERVGPVVYRLKLPHELDTIHTVFHVCMVRRYPIDPSHVVAANDIKVRPDFSYEEEIVKIVAHWVKVIRSKMIPLVKALGRNHKINEATWKTEQ